jgi:cardiolipin synthase C
MIDQQKGSAATGVPHGRSFARVSLCAGVLAAACGVTGCATLPKLEGQVPSAALTDTAGTRLGRAVADRAAGPAAASGIRALQNPREAFAARVVLARMAERSLDLQYYIWHGDTSGTLLMEELWNAAERGVRVRLLLDDNGTAGLDESIAALDSHPSIEVRLFNPFAYRGSRALGYLGDFSRLNHRMHNKSFTADGQLTIVGGRNVGDEYFAAGSSTVFEDLDVIGAGPIAAEVGSAFDRYWNSASAYPAEAIVGRAKAGGVDKLKARFAAVQSSPEAATYLEEVRATPLLDAVRGRSLALEWVPVRLLCDEPEKVLGGVKDQDLLFARLLRAIGPALLEVDLVSPYFVPGAKGAAALGDMPRRGVRLRIVTNSLAATDVGAVHAGYMKSRGTLLRAGARIFELKPGAAPSSAAGGHREGGGAPGGSGSSPGSSSVSLHAKTFVVDRRRVFVGSFNFDPRSARLNTEMGVVIESAALAGAVTRTIDERAPFAAWEVVLDKDRDRLVWVERTPEGEKRRQYEPGAGFFKQLGVGIMSWLPIEGML